MLEEYLNGRLGSVAARWMRYAIAILGPALFHFIFTSLSGENELVASLSCVVGAVVIGVCLGLGPGLVSGVITSLSIHHQYIQPFSQIISWSQIMLVILTIGLVALSQYFIGLLQRARATAVIAQKQADAAADARKEVLAMVTHDLRQPLSAIAMRALALRKYAKIHSPEEAKILNGIGSDVARMERMICDLLDTAKIDSGQLTIRTKTVALDQFVSLELESIRSSYPHIKFHVPSMATVQAETDPDRFQQVLGNLVINAIKYGASDAPIIVQSQVRENMCEFIITNRGPGIAEHQLTRIFDRYARTDRAKEGKEEGLGLGLFITKGIVTALGGKIWAESVPNEWTAFHFTIPILAGPVPDNFMVKAIASREKNQLADKRILVLDDSPDNLEVMEYCLGKLGATIAVSESASDALAKIRLAVPDVILSDIEMPKEDGYAFIKKIQILEQETGRRIPVIAMTGRSDEVENKRILAAGFDQKLTKPLSIEKVLHSIDLALKARMKEN